MRFKEEDQYFRVKYKKLDTEVKLSNLLRTDLKFEIDSDNKYVFSLYPDFETLSEENTVENEWEALDEGTAIMRKPIYADKDGYYDMIRERVNVGAKAWLVGGPEKIAELEIIEILNEI